MMAASRFDAGLIKPMQIGGQLGAVGGFMIDPILSGLGRHDGFVLPQAQGVSTVLNPFARRSDDSVHANLRTLFEENQGADLGVVLPVHGAEDSGIVWFAINPPVVIRLQGVLTVTVADADVLVQSSPEEVVKPKREE